MKVLVVGTGSIGTRHLQNLVELGQEVYAVDINVENLNKVSSMARRVFSSLEEALKVRPDVALICTYSNDHIAPAVRCAEAGCHLFVEKPLSLSLNNVGELIENANKKNLISMVGCNMRFHPALSHVYDILNNNPAFARKLWGNFEFGYYLPFDKKDYETSYKAQRSKGGNLIFDGIHELDCAVWFLGEPVEVFCTKGILSSMKIDTEDSVEMLIRFKTGTICVVHMDYLQHGYTRRCKVVCEDATVIWDFTFGKIGTITTADRRWSWTDIPSEIYYNQMYLDEMKYFLDCVQSSRKTFNSIENSLVVLRLAISANKSCYSNAWERV